jgi:hypothetical protein
LRWWFILLEMGLGVAKNFGSVLREKQSFTVNERASIVT